MFYKNSNNIYFEVFFKLYGIYSTPTDSPYSSAYIWGGGASTFRFGLVNFSILPARLASWGKSYVQRCLASVIWAKLGGAKNKNRIKFPLSPSDQALPLFCLPIMLL